MIVCGWVSDGGNSDVGGRGRLGRRNLYRREQEEEEGSWAKHMLRKGPIPRTSTLLFILL